MADNIAVTPGVGASVATDDVGGVQFQKVKLDIGGDGASSAVTSIAKETGGNLDTIAGDTTSLDGKVTACNTGDVTVGASALPTGAATAAKQLPDGHSVALSATDNAVLDAIATSTDSIDDKTPALGQALEAASVPVVLPAAQITTLTPPAAITNFANETGGNLAAAATSLAVIDDWDDSDKCKVSDGGGSLTIDGTVSSIPTVPAGATAGQGKLDHADVTTAQAITTAVADKYFYITSLTISSSVAGNFWIEDDDATQITCKFYFAPNGGSTQTFTPQTPWKSTTVNKGLKIKGSVAGAIGAMITYYTAT